MHAGRDEYGDEREEQILEKRGELLCPQFHAAYAEIILVNENKRKALIEASRRVIESDHRLLNCGRVVVVDILVVAPRLPGRRLTVEMKADMRGRGHQRKHDFHDDCVTNQAVEPQETRNAAHRDQTHYEGAEDHVTPHSLKSGILLGVFGVCVIHVFFIRDTFTRDSAWIFFRK